MPPDDSAQVWPEGTLLSVLHPRQRAMLLTRGTRRTFAPEEILIREGDVTKDVFLLLDGWVKVTGVPADGRTVLLAIRTGGDVVGELAAMDDRPRSASVAAATGVAARVIAQAHFLSFLEAHPVALLAVSRSISAKMRLATRHRIEATGAPVLQRLARVLLYLAEFYATSCPYGLLIDAPLDRSDLAALVGVSEPSLYRALSHLRDENVLVTRDRRCVIVDVALLEKIARDEAPSAGMVAVDSARRRQLKADRGTGLI